MIFSSSKTGSTADDDSSNLYARVGGCVIDSREGGSTSGSHFLSEFSGC